MGNESVTVIIKNYGGAVVNTPFEVGFSLDNGVTYTKQLINPTIAVDGEYTHTFAATANLSTTGLKQLKFKTFLTGDEDTKNDLYSTTLYVYPTFNYKYINSFETTNGHWYPSGTNNTWAWGIVAKGTINKASDGTKVWTTGGLKSSYNNSEFSYLESPCFDFTSAEYPVFSFDYFMNAENGTDGLRLEYKIEGETSWAQVNSNSNHNLGWSSSFVSALGSNGWTGIAATDYQTARTLLPAGVVGKNNVKFRFVFASDASNTLDGVAIDNIKIYELPYDVGIKRLVSPISGCYISNGAILTAKVTNHGYRPLKNGLKIPIEIKLRNENIVKDTLTIGTLVPSLDSTTFTSHETYNIFTKGTHALRLNTNMTPELDRANDTLKTSLQVRGIPGYSIGADKAVTVAQLADSVKLLAGHNGIVPYNSYLWTAIAPLPVLDVPIARDSIKVNKLGFYSVTVTNENSCAAKDTIEVLLSTSDISIVSSTGLTDACQYSTSVKPQISITNLGPNPIGPSAPPSNQTIPLSIMVDGIVKVSEIFTPSIDIAKDATVNFTFVNGIDLSIPNKYKIKIYSKIKEDPDKSNDTLHVTTNVWGLPKINFAQDTIISLNATSLVLDAGVGFKKYLWTPGALKDTLQTFQVPSNNSAWYYATVTAFHSCGTDTKGVYINAKDLSVISIQNPSPSFCDNESPKVVVVINNSGRDNFATNEKINISYITPEESVSKEFTLTTPLLAGSSRPFFFDNPVKLPSGEGYISVTAKIANDPTSSNNTFERSSEKRLSPTVSFNPSILSKVFGGTPYTISPIYSDGVRSFEWKNPSWTRLNTDSLYTIYDTPPGRSLNVIAYEGLAQTGCKDTATLTIIADDIALDAIKLPTNNCELANNTSVEITISNLGNFTYPSGTQFTADIDVDGVHKFTENFNINSNLAPTAKRDIALTNKLGLQGYVNATIQATITTALDVVASNNTINKTVYATGYPTVNLGSNRTVHAFKDTLTTGNNFVTYEWFRNGSSVATDSTLIVTQSGTYKVDVTDYNGCPGTSNNLVLTFVVDDISLKTLVKPQTGCGLNPTQAVRVTVENTGSEVIPSSKQLTIGFKQFTPPNTIISSGSQIITLGSNLSAGQTKSFDLTGTMNFPGNIEYSVKAWVKMSGDMNLINDTLQSTVQSFPPLLYSQFSLDTIETADPKTTLDAGAGFNSYLWNTSATTQTIDATTSGKYLVEVSNINGCKGKDSVYVKFLHDLTVESIVTPTSPNCSLSSSQTITVKLKNVGNNIISSGSSIQLKLKVATILVATENLVLPSNLVNGSSIDYSFTYKPNLSAIGNHLLEISTLLQNDNNSSNNSIIRNIVVQGSPTPNLGPDNFFLADTIISPGTFSSYLWQDNSTNPSFTVTQTGSYSVTVTDANGCSASDAVVLTKRDGSDIRVSALISPTTNCFNALGQTVTASLTNKGTKTFTNGENIKVTYQINSETPVEETLTFTSNFAYNQSLNYTFNQKVLLDPGAVSMVLKTIIGGNNGIPSATYPITINANPTVDLGADRHFTISTILDPGPGFTLYTWQDNSHNQTFTATTTGNYSVTVTNSNNCQGHDDVNLTLDVGVESIPGTNAKVTLFPNPVNDELTIKIETDIAEVFSIDFVNPQGQIVKTQKTEKALFSNEKLNVKGYTPGIYILKVSNNKGSATFKVIVQR